MVNEQRDSHQQEQRELKHHQAPACKQCPPAFGFAARAQQALHDQLIGAVAGGSEKASAQHTCPKRVGAREELARPGEIEIEYAEFAGRPGHRRHVRPAAWNVVQKDRN